MEKGATEKPNTSLMPIWDRLDSLCRRFWQEDRVAAVALQAVLEEFRGEVSRLDRLEESYSDLRAQLKREYDAAYMKRFKTLEAELSTMRERTGPLEAALSAERARVEEISKELEVQQEANAEFKEKYLKLESERDVTRAKKMQDFYDDLQRRSDILESNWEERHRHLEADYQKKLDELEKVHEEHEKALTVKKDELSHSYEQLLKNIDARESRSIKLEESVRQREDALNQRTRDLEAAYQDRRRELDALKEKLQNELSAVVREYHGKLAEIKARSERA